MPTKYTSIVGELIRLNVLRKNSLQAFAVEDGISWEQRSVLMHIGHCSGCMQADISKRMNVTAAAVTQSTQKLESAGLIEKKLDSTNLRVKRLYITDKGTEALKMGTKMFDTVDNIMFKGFSDNELEQLMDMIKRVNNNMADYKENVTENKMMGI